MKVANLGELHLTMLNDLLKRKYVVYQETEGELIPLVNAVAEQKGEDLVITDKLGFSKEIPKTDTIYQSENNVSFYSADYSETITILGMRSPASFVSVYATKLGRRHVGKILSQPVELEMSEKIPASVILGIQEFLQKQDFDVSVESFNLKIRDQDIHISVNIEDSDAMVKNPSESVKAKVTIKIPSCKVRCIGNNLQDVLSELYGDLVELQMRSKQKGG